MAAPGRTQSGAPDAELYASPRTNHGSAHPLVLDVGGPLAACRVVVWEATSWRTLSSTQSGAPDAECALAPRADHGSAHPSTLGPVPPGMGSVGTEIPFHGSTHPKRHLLPSVQCDAPVWPGSPPRANCLSCAAILAYISFVRGGGPLRALLGVSGGSCDVCTGVYTSLHIISYILMFYRNFELIFEFMALKRAPICGWNVCLAFFLSIFICNSENFIRRK